MASLGKRQEEEKSSLKRGVVADGDSLHLREVRESDAGTYVLRSETFSLTTLTFLIAIVSI